jgi:hypothetical protein
MGTPRLSDAMRRSSQDEVDDVLAHIAQTSARYVHPGAVIAAAANDLDVVARGLS